METPGKDFYVERMARNTIKIYQKPQILYRIGAKIKGTRKAGKY
jgi:hypothetical protein